jgi:hypothetical protein
VSIPLSRVRLVDDLDTDPISMRVREFSMENCTALSLGLDGWVQASLLLGRTVHIPPQRVRWVEPVATATVATQASATTVAVPVQLAVSDLVEVLTPSERLLSRKERRALERGQR